MAISAPRRLVIEDVCDSLLLGVFSNLDLKNIFLRASPVNKRWNAVAYKHLALQKKFAISAALADAAVGNTRLASSLYAAAPNLTEVCLEPSLLAYLGFSTDFHYFMGTFLEKATSLVGVELQSDNGDNLYEEEDDAAVPFLYACLAAVPSLREVHYAGGCGGQWCRRELAAGLGAISSLERLVVEYAADGADFDPGFLLPAPGEELSTLQ